MAEINEMNDWATFKDHMNSDVDKRVASTKALLWVAIAVSGLFNLIALTIAVVALVHAMVLNRDNNALRDKISELAVRQEQSFEAVEDARRVYNNAAQMVHRARRPREQSN